MSPFSPLLTVLGVVTTMLRHRIAQARAHPERGYSTEAVIVTALLAVLALTALGIIASKIIAKANSIDLG